MELCKNLQKKTKEELYKQASAKKNKNHEDAYLKVPFSERVVFVPHCMRSIEKCKAKEMGSYYLCVGCGACKIADIRKKTQELGYKGIFILKGGRTVEKLVSEAKPKAIVGIACYYEGVQGIALSEENKITVQFVPLIKDGCVATDVELPEIFKVLEKKSPL